MRQFTHYYYIPAEDGTAQGGTGGLTITSPPVGIYRVTVFGISDGEEFNESATFFTKEG